ncbi:MULTISPECIES: protease SohB [Francisella]|uniref:Protease SohB n=1 Tax=Francisella opportunistica TaxID=2016517 RepID=A0A345JSB7_9GAMM|nr:MULTISPECIES: protease SohB [Francisella]APC91977.1 SohB protein, peptidase U7 family [Francisella sp. MA067296]AXH30213.1 protease SohB [Francisella opportunistica]AXH31854.1 protease SohB [Francisella opportunistica]AXH33500.1 protease SohB [Francisella opportunistica]
MWYQSFISFVFFFLSTLLVVVAIVFVIGSFFSLLSKAKQEAARLAKGKLEINKIGAEYKQTKQQLLETLLEKKEYKKYLKEQKKLDKQDKPKQKTFVLNFKGDIHASQGENLRNEVSAVLAVANTEDEIIIRIDSPGGVVNGYGFAAAQLERIRQAGINLTVCIDQVAASGGYMMSAVAHKIIAAPFAIVGSIGVVGTIPNIRELLEKNGINVEMHTSGEYKRTLTTVGVNTEEGRDKFKQDLENIHELFKKHILIYRPNLDITKVATGEYWFGKDALELGLVDKIQTYDDYLIDLLNKQHDVYEVSYVIKKEKGLLKSKLTMLKRTMTDFLYTRKII